MKKAVCFIVMILVYYIFVGNNKPRNPKMIPNKKLK